MLFSISAIWGRHRQLDDSLVGQLTTTEACLVHLEVFHGQIGVLGWDGLINGQRSSKSTFGEVVKYYFAELVCKRGTPLR